MLFSAKLRVTARGRNQFFWKRTGCGRLAGPAWTRSTPPQAWGWWWLTSSSGYKTQMMGAKLHIKYAFSIEGLFLIFTLLKSIHTFHFSGYYLSVSLHRCYRVWCFSMPYRHGLNGYCLNALLAEAVLLETKFYIYGEVSTWLSWQWSGPPGLSPYRNVNLNSLCCTRSTVSNIPFQCTSLPQDTFYMLQLTFSAYGCHFARYCLALRDLPFYSGISCQNSYDCLLCLPHL